jgi:hypothetical protein
MDSACLLSEDIHGINDTILRPRGWNKRRIGVMDKSKYLHRDITMYRTSCSKHESTYITHPFFEWVLHT